jgi:hypothetical protein
LLKTARILDKAVRTASQQPDFRIMDIIDQSGPDVLNHLRQDFQYRIQIDNNESIETLAKNPDLSADRQTCWTYCLGELLKLIFEFCPEPVKIAWDHVNSIFLSLFFGFEIILI